VRVDCGERSAPAATIHHGKGGTVDTKRPADVDARASISGCKPDPERGDRPRRTRAETRALRRSAPLTPAQFKELSRLAEQGISPLRHI
jgi:hypothetical protein